MAVKEETYIGFRVDAETGKPHTLAHLAETPSWEPRVYQFENGDKLIGGPDGIDNLPLQELTNRTRYLYHWLRKALRYIPAETTVATVFAAEAPTDGSAYIEPEDGKVYCPANASASILTEDGKTLTNTPATIVTEDGETIHTCTNWLDEDTEADTPDTPDNPDAPTADEQVSTADIDALFSK